MSLQFLGVFVFGGGRDVSSDPCFLKFVSSPVAFRICVDRGDDVLLAKRKQKFLLLRHSRSFLRQNNL